MSTSFVGDIGTTCVVADLTKKGYYVFLPISEHLPFDVVVFHENRFFKVQVKYRRTKNGVLSVECRRAVNNRRVLKYRRVKDTEVDLYAIYCPDTDKCYYISYRDVTKNSFHLRIETPKNRAPSIKFASDYEDVKKALK